MAMRVPGVPGLLGPPTERRGQPARGRIVRLQIGLGHGFIRLADGREVFFHRSDLMPRRTFNALAIGDAVRCDVLDDPVSGARALQVRRNARFDARAKVT
jgi:cold shock CspA family protein